MKHPPHKQSGLTQHEQCVLAKEGPEPLSPTGPCLVLFMAGLMPGCCSGTSGKSLLPVQRSLNPWHLAPFC